MPDPEPKRRNQRGLTPHPLRFEEAVRRVLCAPVPPEPNRRRRKRA